MKIICIWSNWTVHLEEKKKLWDLEYIWKQFLNEITQKTKDGTQFVKSQITTHRHTQIISLFSLEDFSTFYKQGLSKYINKYQHATAFNYNSSSIRLLRSPEV